MVCNKDQIGLVETGRGLWGIGKVDDGDISVGNIADDTILFTHYLSLNLFEA
ncbi:hypothetical protein [Oxalobacter formigenes]|uniref:hypothetical protein n=1 Tax=Oxalobacter formigenes TaxID=847 RepID=UPI00241F743F|nr:hypothetical protein [Oxalobacter formigenes]